MNLTIKTRLVLLGTCLAFIPTLVVGFILSENALREGSNSLRESAQSRLTAISDLTAESISNYFDFIQSQATSFATDVSVIEASREFNDAFFLYAENHKNDLSRSKTSLEGYYANDFEQQFKRLNQNQSAQPNALLDQLSPQAQLLQSVYISENKSPLGEKDAMISAGNGSEYDAVHKRYHTMMRHFQQTFGYYDVFIAEAKTGHIIYSVFKELDFGTSLLTGPYKNTGIGQAFKLAIDGAKQGETFLTDFAPYGPSYNAPASFISTPIYDGQQLIAVLIFQMPVDRINDAVNYQQSWDHIGLGLTGQSYLIGDDQKLRSNVRQMYDQKDSYLKELNRIGLSSPQINEIDVRDTTIGQLSIAHQSVDEALNGMSGNTIETNYLGEQVLAAYQPLSIQGLNWGLITEIHEEEALAPIALLTEKIQRNVWFAAIISLIVGALLGYLVALYLTRPIKHMIHMVNALSSGEGDLTQRLPATGKDELSELSQGINHFIGQIDATLSKALKSVARLIPISEDTASVINKLNDANETQQQQARHLNDLITLTNEASEAVANELKDVDSATKSGESKVVSSQKEITDVANTIGAMSTDITAAMAALDTLKDDTQKITGVIDVINGIAEQTNLLALNAAIEAARAGEAGRGFAVVADEVRTLASKTGESTSEVAAMVAAIQNSTTSVSNLMESSGRNAENSVSKVQTSVNSLESVNDAMQQIALKVQEISDSIVSQQANFIQVSDSYTKMKASFSEVQDQSLRSAQVGTDVMKLGHKITNQLERFKVSADDISMARRNVIREED